MAATKSGDFLENPLDVELLAIFRSLKLCVPLGIPNLIVENDSLLAIKAAQEGEESCILQSNLICDLLRLAECFHSSRFQYVGRLSNNVAHKFSRHAWKLRIYVFCRIRFQIFCSILFG